jgi:hypothetical protein
MTPNRDKPPRERLTAREFRQQARTGPLLDYDFDVLFAEEVEPVVTDERDE